MKGRLYSEFPAMIKYAGIDIYKGFFDAAQNDSRWSCGYMNAISVTCLVKNDETS